MSPIRLGVLLSGSGTNFQAVLDAIQVPEQNGEIAVVISNKEDAYGLERARKASIPAVFANHRVHANRRAYDAQLIQHLKDHRVDWVLLAGFMRIVTPVLLNAFPHRVVNIHPALLPSFKGLNGQQQAFDQGVCISGATVHLVTAEMDAGPIIAQGAVPVHADDTAETIQARILGMEHTLYPMVARWICDNRLSTADGQVRIALRDNESRALFSP